MRVLDMDAPPIVGRRYLVPCCTALSMKTRRRYLVPVNGPIHTDPELGHPATVPHFHVDWRFISNRTAFDMYRIDIDCVGRWNDCYSQALFNMAEIGVGNNEPLFVGERMMVCKRIPPPVTRHRLVSKLEKMCKGRQLNLDTMLCPHKGVPLASLPVEADGCVTCPGHGLRWDVRTGKLRKSNG